MKAATRGFVAAFSAMIAVPDFTSHERPIEVDGQIKTLRYCIKAYPSEQVEVGTVLPFVGECPYRWVHANGQYIVRELYPELYAILQSFAGPEPSISAAPQSRAQPPRQLR